MSQAMTSPTGSELTAFVERLADFRGTLPPHQQALLDALVRGCAELPDGDVQGYGWDGATAKRVAIAAALALGVGLGSVVTASPDTIYAAPLEQPAWNGNMSGGTMGGGTTRPPAGQPAQPTPSQTSVNIPNVHVQVDPNLFRPTRGLTPDQAAAIQQQMQQINQYLQTANGNLQTWNALAPAYQQEYQRAIERVRQQGQGNDPGMDAIFGAATGSSLTQDAQRAVTQLEEQRAALNREMNAMHEELVRERDRLQALQREMEAQLQAQRTAALEQARLDREAANARDNAPAAQPPPTTVMQHRGDDDGRVTQGLINARDNNISVTQPFVEATNDNAPPPPGRTSQRLTDQFNQQLNGIDP